MLAISKLNSIETLISRTLIDMDISHEEFVTTLKEKDERKFQKWKWKIAQNYETELCEIKGLKNKIKWNKIIIIKKIKNKKCIYIFWYNIKIKKY